MSQNQRGPYQNETDISTPELIQHMLVVEDGLSRPDISQRSKLWRRVFVAVHCLGPSTCGEERTPSRYCFRR